MLIGGVRFGFRLRGFWTPGGDRVGAAGSVWSFMTAALDRGAVVGCVRSEENGLLKEGSCPGGGVREHVVPSGSVCPLGTGWAAPSAEGVGHG